MSNQMDNQKGMSTTVVVSIVAILLLVGGGWYALSENSAREADKDAMMVEDESMTGAHEGTGMTEEEGTMMKDEVMIDADAKASFKGAVIAGSSSPLLEFNQRDYTAALESNRVVVLYFYANWCPVCRAEFADTMVAFNSLTEENVVGFRVHFNDDDLTPEMEALAREFGVAYQHTKVFIKNGERVLKSPETWSTERYLTEFANHINN